MKILTLRNCLVNVCSVSLMNNNHMKKILLFTALLFSVFTFGYGQSGNAENENTNPLKLDRYPSIPFLKDSLKLQEQINRYIDSLNLDGKSLSPKGDIRKFRFKNPADSSIIKKHFTPPSNKYPNPNFKQPSLAQENPRIIHVGPDNMPMYVPGKAYIRNRKLESQDNMPMVKPKGFDKNRKLRFKHQNKE